MSKEIKVDAESAENEFLGWVDAMDLLLDEADMDSEDLAAFKKTKRRIVRSIMRGNLTFDESTGNAIYQPKNRETPFNIGQSTGASLMASDEGKKNHDMAKSFKVLAAMAKCHPRELSRLEGEDSKVMLALYMLLMD